MMLATDHPPIRPLSETSETACVSSSAAERQFVNCIDHGDVANVESGESFIRGEIQGIGHQARSIPRGRLVHGIAVIESLRERVNASHRKTAAEAPTQIHLQRVVGAGSRRKTTSRYSRSRDSLAPRRPECKKLPAGTGAPAKGEPIGNPRFGELVAVVGLLGSQVG